MGLGVFPNEYEAMVLPSTPGLIVVYQNQNGNSVVVGAFVVVVVALVVVVGALVVVVGAFVVVVGASVVVVGIGVVVDVVVITGTILGLRKFLIKYVHSNRFDIFIFVKFSKRNYLSVDLRFSKNASNSALPLQSLLAHCTHTSLVHSSHQSL